MNRLIITFLSVLAMFLTQCGKDEGVCISSTGKTITQNRIALPYNYVEVHDNINLFLTQDTSITGIVVEAGENLIDGITTKIDSGRLVLRNRNSCNWLRSFEVPVNVYLTFTQMDTLITYAAGNITCTNDWTNDSIYFEMIEGGGQINLKLQAFKSYIFIQYGTASVNVTGFSQVTFLISHAYGPLHAENLNSKFNYVSSFSPNDLFVNATVELAAEIGNIGDIYYCGDPPVIYTNIFGGGKLIKLYQCLCAR